MCCKRRNRQQVNDPEGDVVAGWREPGETPTSGAVGLERIALFSDAVFAIAITLLVLEIPVPTVSDDRLGKALLDLWPEYLSFVVSFLVIGLFWIGHHRKLRYIVRFDLGLLRLNLLLLLCVAFLPFPSAVFGEYGDTTTAVVFYAACMTVAGLVSAALWAYAASDHRLVRPDLDEDVVRYLLLRSLTVPAAFALSIPVAFVSPRAASLVWLLHFLFQDLLRRHATGSTVVGGTRSIEAA